MARAIQKSCCLTRYRPSAFSPSLYVLQYLTLVLHLHRGLVDKSVKLCFKSSLAHVWLRLHLPHVPTKHLCVAGSVCFLEPVPI